MLSLVDYRQGFFICHRPFACSLDQTPVHQTFLLRMEVVYTFISLILGVVMTIQVRHKKPGLFYAY